MTTDTRYARPPGSGWGQRDGQPTEHCTVAALAAAPAQCRCAGCCEYMGVTR